MSSRSMKARIERLRPMFLAVLDGRDVGVARGAAHHRDDVRELGMWVDPSSGPWSCG